VAPSPLNTAAERRGAEAKRPKLAERDHTVLTAGQFDWPALASLPLPSWVENRPH
jgi:hypothetical protein